MRLAWFTPWPPDRDQAARRSRDIARALTSRGDEIDLFVDAAAPKAPGDLRLTAHAPGLRVLPAPAVPLDPANRKYDLAVYQLVNDPRGAFIWPHLLDRSGLVLLNDVSLYAARAASAQDDVDAFRAEFAWSHPAVSPDAAELAVAGFNGIYGAFWSMSRLVVEAARLVAVPARAAADALRLEWPDARVVTVVPGLAPEPDRPLEPPSAVRSRLGIPDDAVVFAVLDDEAGRSSSRLPHVLRAFASTVSRMPTARLLLAGPREWDPPIPSDVRSAVVRLDARSEEARRRAVGAADVCLDLHWPRAAGPTDGWLAAIAAGKPPVFVDAGAMTDVPALDPRSWRPADRRPPIGVALDILDEDHSLRLAVYRLAIDRGLRERLGRAAQSYWRQHHTLDRMTTDMTMAIEQAVAADEPSRPV